MSDTADIVAIGQLIAAFNHAVDEGDGVGFAALFADGGALDLGHLRVEGKPDLLAFASSVPDRVPSPRHHVFGELVEVDGDLATARSYAQVFSAESGAVALKSTGRYYDRIERTVDGWRFRERRFVVDRAGG